jgi:hypothetical protein
MSDDGQSLKTPGIPTFVCFKSSAIKYLLLLATCFHAGFLLGLFFDPEDGGDMFPRNVA